MNPLRPYTILARPVRLFIAAEFFIHLVNSVFFMILNIYMTKAGYADFEIARYLSWRYLTVMILALPMGLMLRKRRLLPWFAAAGFLIPAGALGIVWAVNTGQHGWLQLLIIAWGIGFFLQHAVALPWLLRNTPTEHHSEAISLNFATWSMSLVLGGTLNFALTRLFPDLVDERALLVGFALVGFVNLWFLSRVGQDAEPQAGAPVRAADWKLIAQALSPTLLIAVGAGLTIQFINLFFFHVFGIDYDLFSLMGASTAVLVSLSVLQVPRIKRRFGYLRSITSSQTLAVLVLVLLATTEYFSYLPWMAAVAVGLYILRQPLMSVANPLTSELVMYYVGEANREMTSALTSAVWSGSWFFSSLLFGILRAREVPYARIFYLTAALYLLGVVLFYFLIRAYERREASQVPLQHDKQAGSRKDLATVKAEE